MHDPKVTRLTAHLSPCSRRSTDRLSAERIARGPLLERLVGLTRRQPDRVIRRRIFDVDVQVLRDRYGARPGFSVDREAAQRKIRPARAFSPTGKRSDVSESPWTKPSVTAVYVEGKGPLFERHHQAPLLDDRPLAGVDGRPTAPEHEGSADGCECGAHQHERRPPPSRHLVGVADRDYAQGDQKHEDAGREEWQAEDRHTPATFTNLQSIRRYVLKRTGHRPSYRRVAPIACFVMLPSYNRGALSAP